MQMSRLLNFHERDEFRISYHHAYLQRGWRKRPLKEQITKDNIKEKETLTQVLH